MITMDKTEAERLLEAGECAKRKIDKLFEEHEKILLYDVDMIIVECISKYDLNPLSFDVMTWEGNIADYADQKRLKRKMEWR